MAPMHHSRNDDPIDIGQNFLERFTLLRGLGWECGANCTRFGVRGNAQFLYFSTIICDPIGQSMQLFAEFRNVAKFADWR